MDGANRSSPHKLVQCRICHDEDEDSNMEPPCSCRGSLKYAHRKCVQRWCNEKGDTICEICQQQFKPGYTAPPPLFHYGSTPLNFRGNWEISRRDLQNHQFIEMFAANREFSDSDAEYSVLSTASLFIALLVLRHTLPVILSGGGEYSLTLYMLLVMRTVAILLPVCVMVKAFTIIQRRRFQDQYSSILQHQESELEQPQSRVIHIL